MIHLVSGDPIYFYVRFMIKWLVFFTPSGIKQKHALKEIHAILTFLLTFSIVYYPIIFFESRTIGKALPDEGLNGHPVVPSMPFVVQTIKKPTPCNIF